MRAAHLLRWGAATQRTLNRAIVRSYHPAEPACCLKPHGCMTGGIQQDISAKVPQHTHQLEKVHIGHTLHTHTHTPSSARSNGSLNSPAQIGSQYIQQCCLGHRLWWTSQCGCPSRGAACSRRSSRAAHTSRCVLASTSSSPFESHPLHLYHWLCNQASLCLGHSVSGKAQV